MKRVVLILAALVIALALFNQFGIPQRASKGNAGESSKTNAAILRPTFHPSPRPVPAAQTDSTNSVSADDEENDALEKLSREQIEAYLLKTKRSPESLLNAFQETGDTNFLAEAASKYPDNPLVEFAMIYNLPSGERAQWLEKLKASSPGNALPNYLSALDEFKAGKTDQALAEIELASSKKVSAFDQEREQSREEMLLLSGYSPLEAKEQGRNFESKGQELNEIRQLFLQVRDLQQKYQAAGDEGSNQRLAAIEIEISRKYSEPNTANLLNQLVGNSIERSTLNTLDPESYYNFLGKTASARLKEIREQRQEWRNLAAISSQSYPNLSEAEKMIYLNRAISRGELNAMRWLKNYSAETK